MEVTLGAITAVAVAFSKIYNNALKEVPEDYKKFATVVETKSPVMTYTWLGQFPNMKEWVGERDVKALTDHKYTITKKDWESTVTVKRDDILFDQLGLLKPQVTELGHVSIRHLNDYLGDLITTNGVCYDGKKFFASDHKIGETTNSNKTNKKFNAENLDWMYQQMLKRKDTNAKSYKIKPTTLYIAADLLSSARTILKSLVIEGSTNTMAEMVEYEVVHDMADGSWCLVDNSRAIKPFIIQITKKAKIEKDDKDFFMKKEMYFGIDAMDNGGYTFWQLAYFSDGTEVIA